MNRDLGPIVTMLEDFAFVARKISMKGGCCCELDVKELQAGGRFLVGTPLPPEAFVGYVMSEKARMELHPELDARNFLAIQELGMVEPTIVEILVNEHVVEVWLIPHSAFELYKVKCRIASGKKLGHQRLVPG